MRAYFSSIVPLFMFFTIVTEGPPVSAQAQTSARTAGSNHTRGNAHTTATPVASGTAGNAAGQPPPQQGTHTDQTSPKKLIVVDGDFRTPPFTAETLQSCGNDCFVITKSDFTIFDGKVDLVSFSANQITLSTTATQTDPAFVYIGPAKNQPKIRYPVSGSPFTRRQVLAGSFCSAPNIELCDTGKGEASGYIFDRPDGISYPLTVDNISPTRAVVTYSVPTDFTPRTILLSRSGDKNAIGNFPFKPAPASVRNQLVYQAYDLQTLCNNEPPKQCVKNLDATSPDQPDSRFDPLAVQDSLLFISGIMENGVPPNTIVASRKKDGNRTVLLRRVTRAAADQSLLDVQMTPMDQETVRRDFGMRIASHYLAVTIDVTNRTSKKLQFNKSAMWFDVDFRAVGDPNRNPQNFLLNAANVATANTMVSPNMYHPAFDPYTTKDEKFCLKRANLVTDVSHPDAKPNIPKSDPFCNQVFYRYGIEQSTHLSPVNYLVALAAFDFTTEKTDRILRFVELLGATLIPISSGSIVAQVHNTAFHDSVSLFTGTFLPGFRGIELDPAHINRLRTNLIAQTLQENIAVPPTGFATTIVLLPRDGMLAVRGRDQAVVIDRLVDVHIDPDVVNGSKDTPVPADLVQVGYTMDQVRQALGEPYKMTPDEASGQTVFGYKSGAYSDVTFNKEGRVIASTQYTLAQQVAQKNTLPEATDFLRKNNLPWTRLTLLNGNSILVDIPTLDNTTAPLFDGKDKSIGTYTLLYPQIIAAAGQTPAPTVDAFASALKGIYLGSGDYPAKTGTGGKSGTFTFAMPDIIGGYITVSLDKDTGKQVQPSPKFSGSRPASFTTTTSTKADSPAPSGSSPAKATGKDQAK